MDNGQDLDLGSVASAVRNSVARMVRRLRLERADEEELSLFKLIILGSLSRRGPITATELSAAEHIRPQSLTRLLTFLEDRGLVKRDPDEADRRRLLITVTDRGIEALEANIRGKEAWLASVIGQRMSHAEREDLLHACRLLDRLSGGE